MKEIEGIVTSGLQEAGEFIEKEVYHKQYMDKLGFIPYKGTLNIKLKNDITLDINDKLSEKLKKIDGDETLGDVYFLYAVLTNKNKTITKEGAILFPVKTVYTTNTLEFISHEKLRETMNLKDGTTVILEINE